MVHYFSSILLLKLNQSVQILLILLKVLIKRLEFLVVAAHEIIAEIDGTLEI